MLIVNSESLSTNVKLSTQILIIFRFFLQIFKGFKQGNFCRPPNSGLVTWSRRLKQEPGIQVIDYVLILILIMIDYVLILIMEIVSKKKNSH